MTAMRRHRRIVGLVIVAVWVALLVVSVALVFGA